jgi:hypothetical protein
MVAQKFSNFTRISSFVYDCLCVKKANENELSIGLRIQLIEGILLWGARREGD